MSSRGEDLHVLAVDDSTVDLKIIERMLKRSSVTVTTVDSPKTALELLGIDDEDSDVDESELPEVDLIITDYCMPEMSGLELLKRVKESSALRDIPVVVVSSEYIPSRIHRCMDEGAEDFLLKPLRQSEVSRLCSRVLKQSRMYG